MKVFKPFVHLIHGEATEHEMFIVGLEFVALITPFILIFGNHLK